MRGSRAHWTAMGMTIESPATVVVERGGGETRHIILKQNGREGREGVVQKQDDAES